MLDLPLHPDTLHVLHQNPFICATFPQFCCCSCKKTLPCLCFFCTSVSVSHQVGSFQTLFLEKSKVEIGLDASSPQKNKRFMKSLFDTVNLFHSLLAVLSTMLITVIRLNICFFLLFFTVALLCLSFSLQFTWEKMLCQDIASLSLAHTHFFSSFWQIKDQDEVAGIWGCQCWCHKLEAHF